jgi:hypothetical protein
MFNRIVTLGLLLLALLFPAIAQEAAKKKTEAATSTPATTLSPASSTPVENTLSSEFHGIRLGMGLDELKSALLGNSLFSFRGDRDVSLLPAGEQVLIETSGLSFVKRAFFQLRDNRLFIMAYSLNTETMDHYSVFSALVANYGDPDSLNPKEAVWLSDEVRLSVERPLTVKYIDRKVFDKLALDSKVTVTKETLLREEFLDAF